MLDYGARFYDPMVARWGVIDPLAEKYNSISPYNYTDNNPVNNTDPNGAETYYGTDATTIFTQLQSQLSGNTGPEDPTYGGNKGKPLKEVKVVGRMNLEDMYYSRIERGLDPFSGYSRALSVKGWYDSKMSVYNDIENNQFHRFIYDGASFYAGGEIGGAALGGMFRYGKGLFNAGRAASGGLEKVFWSGGEEAFVNATNYAESAPGRTTLEMTRAGKNLMKLIETKNIPWKEAKPMWERLSAMYARGASGTVHFFPGTVNPEGIWMTVEKDILLNNGVKIVTH